MTKEKRLEILYNIIDDSIDRAEFKFPNKKNFIGAMVSIIEHLLTHNDADTRYNGICKVWLLKEWVEY